MNTDEPTELDALVAQIWGRQALDEPPDVESEIRESKNKALSIAIRMYLQSYFDDLQTTL